QRARNSLPVALDLERTAAGIRVLDPQNNRRDRDALPFCKATLHGVRCPHGPYFVQVTGYPSDPKTIGEAIRKRRLDLGLRQIEVANLVGCNELTIVNWEKGHTRPRTDKMSAIETFLGTSAKRAKRAFQNKMSK